MTDSPGKARPGGYHIRHPSAVMTPGERAEEMWRVHPADLDRLGMDREELHRAHIEAAVNQDRAMQ
jgi:hypothetical protein